jgi:hypothetical protein
MNIRNSVYKMLLERLHGSNIGLVLEMQAKRRIEESGKDIGGYAKLWADTAKLTVKTKRGYVVKYHYRAGGTPLYDTGNLYRSLIGKTENTTRGLKLTLEGSMIALLQHSGFKTSGPNFIPFTQGALRRDKAALKNREFVIARKGVTVPARPIFAMPSSAKKELVRNIAIALGAR